MAVKITDGSLSWNATIDDSDLNRIADKIQSRIGDLSKNVQKEGDQMGQIFRQASAAAAGFFSIQAGTNFIQTLVKTRGEFQQLEIAFTTMLGSKERADRLMKDVVQFAATTPFDLQQVAGGTKQLLAYGFAADGIRDNLSMLGNIAAGVGSQINDIIYLYGTLKASGRVTQMDINQFAGRGIPIYEELAKVMGKNVDEIRDLVSAGRVGFPQIEQAFSNMTSSGGRFFNLMQEQSKSLTGQISNLGDSISQMFNEIGRGQEGVLSTGIAGIAVLVDNYEKVIQTITALIAIYGVHRAAVIVSAAVQLSAAQAASGVTLAFRLQYAQMIILDRMHKILNATMLANPYVAIATVLATLAAAVYTYSKSIDGAALSQKSLNQISAETAKTYEIEANKLNSLLEVARNETLSKERRKKAIAEINRLSPEHLGNISLETIKTKEATSAIDDYLKALNRQIELKIANEELESLIRKGQEGPGFFEEFVLNVKNLGFGVNQALGQSLAYTEFMVSNLEAQKAVKDKIRSLIEDDDKKTTNNSETKSSVRSEQFIKGEIERLEGLKSALDIHSKEYKDYTNQIKTLNEELQNAQGKLTSQQKKDNTERLKVLEDISRAEAEAFRKTLSQNEQQIQAERDKYQALREEAKKAGLGPEAITRIDRVEKTVTGNLQYEQDTKELKTALDKQKQLYSEFEDYKKTLGEKLAKERYGKEIDLSKSYMDELQSELALTQAQAFAGGFTGPIQERIKLLIDAIDEERRSKQSARDKEFAEAYTSTLNAEQKIQNIRKEYAEKAKALGANITAAQKEELIKQQDLAIDAAKDEMFKKSEIYRKLSEETFLFTKSQLKREIKVVEDLLKNTTIPADLRTQLERDLAGLKVNLKIGVDEANIQALKAREADLITALSNPLVKGTENAKKYKKELKETRDQINAITKNQNAFDFLINDEVAEKAEEISRATGALGMSFNQLGSELSYFNEGLGDTVSTMGDLLGVASNAAGSVASFASGDIIGGITKGISAITGIFSIRRKALESERKAQEEVRQYNLDLQKGEREYQALLRERERQLVRLNKITLQGLKDQAALLGTQSGSIQSEFDRLLKQVQAGEQKVGEATYKYGGFLGIGRKTGTRDITEGLSGKTYEELEKLFTEGKLTEGTKALFEQLQKLKNEGEDVKKALADLADEANQLYTGTTAASITDSIVEGFKNGYRTAEDFANNFQELMQGAMLNTFKYKVVEAQIEDFYASFAERAKSDEQLTQQEIDALKAQYSAIIANSATRFEELQQITGGFSPADTVQTGLKGAIRREMTEATASELTGLYRATYDLTKQMVTNGIQQLSISNQHLMIAIKIESNTKETAENTRRLEAIENGITTIANNSKNSQSARDMGLGG